MAEKIGNKPVRASNFELLRILSMFIIVLYHCCYYGGFDFGTDFSSNQLIVQLLNIGGKLGVNVFVLISSYFLCTQPLYRWKSIVKFIFQVTVFSVIIDGIFFVVSPEAFSVKQLVKTFFPLIFSDWWFANAYFFFSLSTPLLCKMLQSINKTQHLLITAVLFVLWSILPTLIEQYVQLNNLLWFFFLFFVAAYIRKYPQCFTKKKKNKIFIGLIAAISLFFIGYFAAVDFMNLNPTDFKKASDTVVAMTSVPLFMLSVLILCLFSNMKPFYSKGINLVASSVFGVYLIHDHLGIREFLWTKLFNNQPYQDSPALILRLLLSAIAVFSGCLLLSLLYKFVFEKPLDALLKKYGEKIENTGRKIQARIEKII